jgi:hypothetical protein
MSERAEISQKLDAAPLLSAGSGIESAEHDDDDLYDETPSPTEDMRSAGMPSVSLSVSVS